jgi:mannonate dehydratase
MRVSVRLNDLSDNQMRFYRQIGVEDVDLAITIVPEYHVGGRLGSLKIFMKVFKKIREAGLNIALFRTCHHDFSIRNFLLGKPEGEEEVEEICKLIKFLGGEGIPVAQIAVGSSAGGLRGGPPGVPGGRRQTHRGGYAMHAFSMELFRKQMAEKDLDARWAHHFKDEISFEDYWTNIIKAYERIIPIAEESDIKIAIHTDDPPIPDGEGLLPGIQNPLKFNRLFDAVPSSNSGLLFCVGERYESGIDIIEQIKMFGGKKKIFHIHFRNVRGTLPSSGAYEEVMLDDGDMEMFRVLEALDRVGYEGCLNPDHYPLLDVKADPTRNAALAWSVGYVKALLSALTSKRC